MDKTILRRAQQTLLTHSWGTFVLGPPSMAQGGTGVVVPGCEVCQKYITTPGMFMHHLAEDVLPGILVDALERDSISAE